VRRPRQTDRLAVVSALHQAYLTLGGLTILSSVSFWTLRAGDADAARTWTEKHIRDYRRGYELAGIDLARRVHVPA